LTPTPPPLRATVAGLFDDAKRFARAEIGLVRAQGIQAGKRIALAAALLATAALCLLLLVIMLLGAAATAVGDALGMPWLGWLCVAFLMAVIAAVAGLIGFRAARGGIAEGKRVGATVKEDLEWLRELPKRSGSGS
jgi:uncharacterized RDD family membrane protein YckC